MVDIGIFVGSVYGNAQFVAEQLQESVQELGKSVEVYLEPTLDDFSQCNNYLFVSSTTGEGDIPPNLEFFMMDLKSEMPLISGKPFAVVAMGDSSYGDSYCGAGKQIFETLLELKGQAISELLEIDACETMEPEKDALAWLPKLAEKWV